MVGRSPSTIRAGGAAAAIALLLGACAAGAPALPPDTTGSTSLHHVSVNDFTPADAALSCTDINAESAELKVKIEQANANIMANRAGNQAAAYIGAVIFPPAYLATEGNYADKDAIKAAYARQDVLLKLTILKGC